MMRMGKQLIEETCDIDSQQSRAEFAEYIHQSFEKIREGWASKSDWNLIESIVTNHIKTIVMR